MTETYRCTDAGYASYSEIEIDIERPQQSSNNQNVRVKGIRFLGFGGIPGRAASRLRSQTQVLRIHMDLSQIPEEVKADPIELSHFFQNNPIAGTHLSTEADYSSYGSRQGLAPNEWAPRRSYPVNLAITAASGRNRMRIEPSFDEQRIRNDEGLSRTLTVENPFALNSTPMRRFLDGVAQSGHSRLAQCLTCPLLVGYDPALILSRIRRWTNQIPRTQHSEGGNQCEIRQPSSPRSCYPL